MRIKNDYHISVLIVSNVAREEYKKTLESVAALHPHILIDDTNLSVPLGVRKQQLIKRAKTEWVLLLDTDEVVSKELCSEIAQCTRHAPKSVHGFRIPYKNHVFGHPVYSGGEAYSKVRLFRKAYGSVTPYPLHEEVTVEGGIQPLTGVILHYSYRSLPQVIKKFTGYARVAAAQKRLSRERCTVRKLLLYGPHMVCARYIEDRGYRDGWRGLVLSLLFGYMEALTYWMLCFGARR